MSRFDRLCAILAIAAGLTSAAVFTINAVLSFTDGNTTGLILHTLMVGCSLLFAVLAHSEYEYLEAKIRFARLKTDLARLSYTRPQDRI